MTLIVAKIVNGKIRIDSDSKISYAYKSSNPFTDGILKNVILSPNVCLSYAGTVIDEHDNNVIEELISIINRDILDKNSHALDQIAELALCSHRDGGSQTDYILSSSGEFNRIIKIAGNQIHEGQSTYWIGSSDAFNMFQYHFHENNNASIFSRMMDAFQSTIAFQDKLKGVGGFQLSVGNKNGYFRYLLKGSLTAVGKTHQYGESEHRVGIGEKKKALLALPVCHLK